MKKIVEYKSMEDLFNYKWTKWESFVSFIWYRPKRKIVDAFYQVKYAYQRAFRGYDDREVFSIDHFFVERQLKILKEFKKYNCGYPCGSITPENWDNIIQQMIDDLQFISNYSWDFDKDEEVDKHKDHFFYLFSKWFFHIWY